MSGSDRVLVLGGTGHFGRYIVGSLVGKGAPVRVLSRTPARAAARLPSAVEVMEGDLGSPEAVTRALREVGRLVVSVSAFSRAELHRMRAIERDAVMGALSRAQTEGVRRAVYVSIFDIRPEIPERLHLESAEIKRDVETHLAGSALDWTVVGAPPSMELFFAMVRGDRMIVPGGGPKAIPTISPLDLGEIVAQAVLRDDLGGRRIRLAGPQLLSFPEAAERLSTFYGRSIRFTAIPLLLPKIAWYATRVPARLSRTLSYLHAMLGYVQLLNAFPQNLARASVDDHAALTRIFDYTPTTLEMEAARRAGRGETAA